MIMNTATIDYALLRDGGQVLIRPYLPEDRTAVTALFAGMSDESRMLRFHTAGTAGMDERMLDLVTAGRVLVAELGGAIVALASYVRLRDPQRAEMAIVVHDAHHGRGIGTVLFEQLSRDAQRQGIRRFVALVLA